MAARYVVVVPRYFLVVILQDFVGHRDWDMLGGADEALVLERVREVHIGNWVVGDQNSWGRNRREGQREVSTASSCDEVVVPRYTCSVEIVQVVGNSGEDMLLEVHVVGHVACDG